MAREKVRRSAALWAAATPGAINPQRLELPERIAERVYFVHAEPQFLADVCSAANDYRWFIVRLRDRRDLGMRKADARRTMAEYKDLLERTIEFALSLPIPLRSSVFLTLEKRLGPEAARSSRTALRTSLYNELGAVIDATAWLKTFRAPTLAQGRKVYMSVMRDLFKRRRLVIPKNPDSPLLGLCQDVAAWCGDRKDAATFVRAIP